MSINCEKFFAFPGGEGFIVEVNGRKIIVDTGYGFCGEKTVEDLTEKLKKFDNEKIDMIFLTHSHYDHALASVYIKRKFDYAPILASEHTKEILTKTRAHALMRDLDKSASKYYDAPAGEDVTPFLSVDRVLYDGEDVFGDNTCISYAFPGHTKCCMGLYFPEEKFLISCETLGLWSFEESSSNVVVASGGISSMKNAMQSIKKAQNLDIDKMLISHHGMYYGNENCKKYLENAMTATKNRIEEIITLLNRGKTDEEIVAAIKNSFYTERIATRYPLQAFLTNTFAQIQTVKKEFTNQMFDDTTRVNPCNT